MQPGTPETPLPRRERERGMRRSAMLAAARQVLAEKGFAETTIEEITHRAEFGKGTLYNYFPGGKEEILLAVVSDLYDDLAALVEGSFAEDAGNPVREQFRNFMARVFAHFTERQELFAILMKEAHRMGFSGDRERVRFYLLQREKVAAALLAPIRRAIESGEMRPLPPDSIVHMLLGNIQGLQMQLALQAHGAACEARPWSPDEASSIVTTILFDGLLTDPARPQTEPGAGSDAHA